MKRLMLFSFIGLTACATPPELDDKFSADAKNAPYPTLMPISPADPELGKRSETALETLAARRARLQRRAAILRAGQADDATRRKLSRSR
ncbi:MAG: hypothetical protein ACPGVK_07060 [Halocynthiibacter sp.]